MAEALSESELEELREVFDMMDKDKGGSLNVEEVKQLLDLLGMKMRMDEVEAMVADIDHDRSGEVEFDEFVKVMTSTHQLPHSKEDVMRAFKLMLPKDAPEGFIKKEELEKALLHYAVPKFAEDEILRLLSEWQCDEHGVIDYRSKVNTLMH